jgi:hypothetical protein
VARGGVSASSQPRGKEQRQGRGQSLAAPVPSGTKASVVECRTRLATATCGYLEPRQETPGASAAAGPETSALRLQNGEGTRPEGAQRIPSSDRIHHTHTLLPSSDRIPQRTGF